MYNRYLISIAHLPKLILRLANVHFFQVNLEDERVNNLSIKTDDSLPEDSNRCNMVIMLELLTTNIDTKLLIKVETPLETESIPNLSPSPLYISVSRLHQSPQRVS